MAGPFQVGRDIGGFGRLAEAVMYRRREERLDKQQAIQEKESALRRRLSEIQLKQAESNLAKISRDQKLKSDITLLIKNLPEGETRFTASYKYLMEQGAVDLSNELMKAQSDMIEDVYKMDPYAGAKAFNDSIGRVLNTTVKPVPNEKDIIEATNPKGETVYLKRTPDGFVKYEMPQGHKAKSKKSKETFEMALKIRGEIDKSLKDFNSIASAFNRIESVDATSPAGGLALIFNYMKLLDPGSVVRESEFRTAEQARAWVSEMEGSGYKIPSGIKQAIQKFETGQRLLPEQIKDFKAQALNLYEGQKRMADATKTSYINLASKYGIPRDEVDISRGTPYKTVTADWRNKEPAEITKDDFKAIDLIGEKLEKAYMEKLGLTPEDAERRAFNDILDMQRSGGR